MTILPPVILNHLNQLRLFCAVKEAGKTALLNPAYRDLSAIGPTVVVNGDDLRSFHPQYQRLQSKDPETLPN